MRIIIAVLFFVLALTAIPFAAEQGDAAKCHCFQDRIYKPEDRFAADEYLLATSFNSFIAVNFNLSKGQIVMMKMKQGIDPDILLIALYAAREGHVGLNSILVVMGNGGDWQQVLQSESMHDISPGASKVFTKISADGSNHSTGSEIVTDELLSEYFSLSEKEIDELRKKNAGSREIVLANILAAHAKPAISPAEIMTMYVAEGKSWSEIAFSFGFTPKDTGRLLLEKNDM